MAERERPLYYETRRDPPDGNVTRKRGKLRLFAVYAAKEKGGNLRASEVKPLACHAAGWIEQGVANNEGRDLARTILGHWLGTKEPHQALYNPFTSAVVAQASQHKSMRVTAEQIEKFLAAHAEA